MWIYNRVSTLHVSTKSLLSFLKDIHLSRMCIDFVFSQLCYPEKTLGVSFFIFLDCSSLLVQSVDISGVSKNTKNQQTVLQLTISIRQQNRMEESRSPDGTCIYTPNVAKAIN